MPAEWSPHAATWLAWPHDPATWPGKVREAEEVFVQMIRALAPHERVELLVKDAATESGVQARLADERVANVRLHRIPTADSWIRDYGPLFVKNDRGEVAFVDWVFNAWGGKYEALLADDGIPPRLEPVLGLRRFEAGLVLEGGSIDVNGAGTLLTTEQCLLNRNRNPSRSRAEIEQALRGFLGATHVLWLPEGIEGDDTDGHIDDVARFVDARTIVAAVEPDPRDANHRILRGNLERLRALRDPAGRPFRIVELPMPGRVEGPDGRLPASYANFYIANRVVLLPVFGQANDRRAQAALAPLFPGRRIVPIRCEHLVMGLGAIHCVTQQQPHGPGDPS